MSFFTKIADHLRQQYGADPTAFMAAHPNYNPASGFVIQRLQPTQAQTVAPQTTDLLGLSGQVAQPGNPHPMAALAARGAYYSGQNQGTK